MVALVIVLIVAAFAGGLFIGYRRGETLATSLETEIKKLETSYSAESRTLAARLRALL